MNSKRPYHAHITRGAALLQETYAVFSELERIGDLRSVRESVVEHNLMAKRSDARIKSIWRNIGERYFEGRPKEEIENLSKVVNSSLPKTARDLILFYEFSRSDPLIYDLTTECLFDLYKAGRSMVNKSDVRSWLDKAEASHPELAEWTNQTIERVIRHYLALTKDFGLLEGKRTKAFSLNFVPISTFLWVLYQLRSSVATTKAMIHSRDWDLFFLEDNDVKLLARQAAREGWIHFQDAGNIIDLNFKHESFRELLNGLEAKV